jgi:hypothetical protein
MAYVVKILPRAQRDLEELFEEIRVQHSEASLVWYAGLTKAMFSLDEHPNRCPIASSARGINSGTFYTVKDPTSTAISFACLKSSIPSKFSTSDTVQEKRLNPPALFEFAWALDF